MPGTELGTAGLLSVVPPVPLPEPKLQGKGSCEAKATLAGIAAGPAAPEAAAPVHTRPKA